MFAALGAYIINYIRVLVPDDAYLSERTQLETNITKPMKITLTVELNLQMRSRRDEMSSSFNSKQLLGNTMRKKQTDLHCRVEQTVIESR